MTGFEAYTPYFAAALTVIAAACVYGFHQIREMQKKQRFYSFAQNEIDSGLLAAERVLRDEATPTLVRRTLLTMLNTLANPNLGVSFMRKFTKFMDERSDRRDASNPLTEAMESLHGIDQNLAADAHRAFMTITLLAIPMKYADRIDVSEVEVMEYVSKGATNPDSIFERVGKAARRFNGDDQSGNGVAMPC